MRAFLEQNWWMGYGWEGTGFWWGLKRMKTRNWRNIRLGLLVWESWGARHLSYILISVSISSSLLPYRVKARDPSLSGYMPRGRCWPERQNSWRSKFLPRKYEHVSPGFGGLLRAGWMWIIWEQDQVGHEFYGVEIIFDSPGILSMGQWYGWNREESWGGERGWLWEILSPQRSTWDVLHEKPHVLIQLLYFSIVPPFSLFLGSNTARHFFRVDAVMRADSRSCWPGQQHAGRIAPYLLWRHLLLYYNMTEDSVPKYVRWWVSLISFVK